MSDFRFHSPRDLLNLGAARAKYHANLDALRVLKQLVAEGRAATINEQRVLSRYVGWGDSALLNLAFPHSNDTKPASELASLLTGDEIDSLRASSLNAHYTALPVIAAIWDALLHAGLASLPMVNALEPSAGIGHFIGLSPRDVPVRWTAVEIEPLTAGILRSQYPSARVFAQPFESVDFPAGYFDLIAGNVPFGDYPVADVTLPQRVRRCIHDYFLCKSVTLLRPGAIVALITSRYSLDKRDDAARMWLSQHARLLTAVRLPEDAFKANAGTEVVTDVLVFQRHAANDTADAHENTWVHAVSVEVPGENGEATPQPHWVNRWFVEHPDLILGRQVVARHGMYGRDALTVRPDGRDLEAAVREALCRTLPTDLFASVAMAPHAMPICLTSASPVVGNGQPSIPTHPRIEAMLDIHRSAKRLIQQQVEGASEEDIASARAELNRRYDNFASVYGPLNAPANLRLLSSSPASSFALPFLRALEVQKGSRWLKAGLFTAIVRGVRATPDILSPKEALLTCLDHIGRVDLDEIGRLCNQEPSCVSEALAGLIFEEPGTPGQWVTADEYLSGNVRHKLKQARAIAAFEPRFQANVAALEPVQPEPLRPDEITAHLGSPWVPPDVVATFVRHLVPSYSKSVSAITALGSWDVLPDRYAAQTAEATSRWGTPRRTALDLIADALNQRTPTVYDELDDGVRVVNQEQTLATQEKLAAIKAEFEHWVWVDPDRAAQLAAIYNERFNGLRARHYDAAHLTLPGMSASITLRPHQRDVIWRILQSRATLLGHAVGLGKTFVMVAAAMELKRLGLIRKALVVAPKHLVDSGQFAAEAQRLYPGATILAQGSDDFTPARRAEVLARIATGATRAGDWDLVIVSHSSFKALPVSDATFNRFVQAEIDRLEEVLLELKAETEGEDGPRHKRTLKQIEKAKKRLEARLRNTEAGIRRDDRRTLTWDELGIDALFVDEAQAFKNLGFATKMTRIAGLPNAHSERAFDLFIKTRDLIERGGRVVFATGTPVSNSLAEVFTMQRFLQLDDLKALGVDHFDAWAHNFAEAAPGLEMKPDGSGFRMNTRFSRFVNLPELAMLWRQVLDVRHAEQVGLEQPERFGGRNHIVTVPASRELKRYIQHLARRVERIKSGAVNPKDDNLLKITTDGRKAALDMRLVQPGLPEHPNCKINALAHHVAVVYHGSTKQRGAQLVFCDLATPKGSKRESESEHERQSDVNVNVHDHDHVDDSDDTNGVADAETAEERSLRNGVYSEIKRKLIARGVPANEIAFIHDCTTKAAKSELFEAVRQGRVRVLIGSTEKMGTGMNVQTRLVALHHLDAAWLPASLTQREGRILRQGNRHHEVLLFNYVTQGSFDAFMWGVLETKARFIGQIMAGEVTARTADDVGDMVLTAAQVKAIASGNPEVLRKVGLEIELVKLDKLRAAHYQSQRELRFTLSTLPGQIEWKGREIALHQASQAKRDAHPLPDGRFEMRLRVNLSAQVAQPYDRREAAGRKLRELAEMLAMAARREATPGSVTREVGAYRGFAVWLKASTNVSEAPTLLLKLSDAGPATGLAYEAHIGDSDQGVMQSIDHQLRSIEEHIASAERDRARLEQQHGAIQHELGKPWEHAARFEAVKVELAALDAALRLADKAHASAGSDTKEEGIEAEDDTPEPWPLAPDQLADLSALYAGDPDEEAPVHMDIAVQSGGAAVTFSADTAEATLTTNAPAVITVKARMTMEEMRRALAGAGSTRKRTRPAAEPADETMSLFG